MAYGRSGGFRGGAWGQGHFRTGSGYGRWGAGVDLGGLWNWISGSGRRQRDYGHDHPAVRPVTLDEINDGARKTMGLFEQKGGLYFDNPYSISKEGVNITMEGDTANIEIKSRDNKTGVETINSLQINRVQAEDLARDLEINDREAGKDKGLKHNLLLQQLEDLAVSKNKPAVIKTIAEQDGYSRVDLRDTVATNGPEVEERRAAKERPQARKETERSPERKERFRPFEAYVNARVTGEKFERKEDHSLIDRIENSAGRGARTVSDFLGRTFNTKAWREYHPEEAAERDGRNKQTSYRHDEHRYNGRDTAAWERAKSQADGLESNPDAARDAKFASQPRRKTILRDSI